MRLWRALIATGAATLVGVAAWVGVIAIFGSGPAVRPGCPASSTLGAPSGGITLLPCQWFTHPVRVPTRK